MNIIVFDTETIGKVSQDLLNIGYEICDVNIQAGTRHTLVKRDYLVSNLINNKVYCLNDDFVGIGKYSMYMDLLSKKGIIKRSIPQIFKTMQNDLKKHKVLFGYAYNCDFDIDKFNRTSLKFGIDNPLANLPIFDIWAYASNLICNTEDYKAWARENEILTPSEKYIQTSVEGVSKYLYNDLDFKEDHTALSDTQHELNILLECVKRGCDITRPMQKTNLIPSEKVFTKQIVTPTGQVIEFEYMKEFTRNGKTTYKK